MAQDNNEQVTTASSEISTIRDILVGPQLAEIEQNLSNLGEDQEQDRKHFQEQIKALEEKVDGRLQDMQRQFSERLDQLEAELNKTVEEFNSKLETVRQTDKADLGQMLGEIANRLNSARDQ